MTQKCFVLENWSKVEADIDVLEDRRRSIVSKNYSFSREKIVGAYCWIQARNCHPPEIFENVFSC